MHEVLWEREGAGQHWSAAEPGRAPGGSAQSPEMVPEAEPSRAGWTCSLEEMGADKSRGTTGGIWRGRGRGGWR